MIFNSIKLLMSFESMMLTLMCLYFASSIAQKQSNIAVLSYERGNIYLFKILYVLSHKKNKQAIHKSVIDSMAKKDDVVTLRFLSKHGFDINTVNASDNSLLMLSLLYGANELIDYLLHAKKNNVDVLMINKEGQHALGIAIEKSVDIKIVSQLLIMGADPNYYSIHEDYQLHPVIVALVNNNEPLLDLLLKHEHFIMTPELLDALAVLFLSEVPINGYYVYLINRYALFKSECGNPYIRTVLYDTEPSEWREPHAVNEKDLFGLTALHYAVILNKTELFQDLISVPEFNVSKVESQGNRCLIELALSSDNTQMVKHLVQLKGINMPGYFLYDKFILALLDNIQAQQFKFLMGFLLKNYVLMHSGLNEALNHESFRNYLLGHMDIKKDRKFLKTCCERFENNKNIYGLYQLSIFTMLRNLCKTSLLDLDRVISDFKLNNNKQPVLLQKLPSSLFMSHVTPFLVYEDHQKILEVFQSDVSRGTPDKTASRPSH